jgi:hypothetical protein
MRIRLFHFDADVDPASKLMRFRIRNTVYDHMLHVYRKNHRDKDMVTVPQKSTVKFR